MQNRDVFYTLKAGKLTDEVTDTLVQGRKNIKQLKLIFKNGKFKKYVTEYHQCLQRCRS